MSAARAKVMAWVPQDESNREWAELSTNAPQLVATMRRYLIQLTTFLAPSQRRGGGQLPAPTGPLAGGRDRGGRGG